MFQTMIDMCPNSRKQRGIALLSVLILIVVTTILSLSFISRSDGELAYGRNMKLYMQTAYLADSGLAHARALILNPQDINVESGEYWTGATGQHLGDVALYYNVSVQRHSSG
ncbi:MAG TPA: hypothetical protein VLH60_05210, partial [Sedimentisphaerales bacterium]|nr:hypothetical protein [Sedimentisphaerales bacterium]